jgi:hypothetical protein
MPNGKEKDEAKEKFENILKDFIKEANKTNSCHFNFLYPFRQSF